MDSLFFPKTKVINMYTSVNLLIDSIFNYQNINKLNIKGYTFLNIAQKAYGIDTYQVLNFEEIECFFTDFDLKTLEDLRESKETYVCLQRNEIRYGFRIDKNTLQNPSRFIKTIHKHLQKGKGKTFLENAKQLDGRYETFWPKPWEKWKESAESKMNKGVIYHHKRTNLNYI